MVEKAWIKKKADKADIKAAENSLKTFILDIVDDTWTCKLEDVDTYYNAVSAQEVLKNLEANCKGLKNFDVVDLQVKMGSWWNNEPVVPQYIKRLEKAQKKALRSQFPIADSWLVAISSKSLLVANAFPTEWNKWYGLPSAQRSWTAWKKIFLEAHATQKRERRAAAGRGDKFGTASTATGAGPQPANVPDAPP
uniref:Uncharacterized protein n=1 Tax=Odontella aurita TaxID=265563 RepID=A0A7S4MP29_9STRA|mmetsp:Transcript_27655/g.81296  ORF Transcript_27655/g.81296 Transcript_27655/m.81296 type:complete len:194 (+) Transcript_27655:898-1479(+)